MYCKHPYGFSHSEALDKDKWKVKLHHVELAIKMSNNSASGPDGIPYAAWCNAGRQAAIILLEAITQLHEDEFDNSSVPDNFNASYLCCLPKKQ